MRGAQEGCGKGHGSDRIPTGGEQWAYSSIAMGMGLGLKIASVLTLASLAWLLFGTKESH